MGNAGWERKSVEVGQSLTVCGVVPPPVACYVIVVSEPDGVDDSDVQIVSVVAEGGAEGQRRTDSDVEGDGVRQATNSEAKSNGDVRVGFGPVLGQHPVAQSEVAVIAHVPMVSRCPPQSDTRRTQLSVSAVTSSDVLISIDACIVADSIGEFVYGRREDMRSLRSIRGRGDGG